MNKVGGNTENNQDQLPASTYTHVHEYLHTHMCPYSCKKAYTCACIHVQNKEGGSKSSRPLETEKEELMGRNNGMADVYSGREEHSKDECY